MKRLLLLTLLCACGDVHLGDYYGRRTRTALDAARDAKTEPVALDAADAKLVSQRYHNTPTQGAAASPAALVIPTTGSYGASGTSSMTGVAPAGPPASGIRLDAVR